MRCKDAKFVLNAWIDNELTGETRGVLEDHLATCRVCAEQAKGLSKLARCLDTHPRAIPSKTLQKRIMAEFMEESGSLSLGHWWKALGWELQTAMAASTIIGLFIGFQLGGNWTGSQLLDQYSITGFLFSAGDLLLSWT